MTWTPTPVGSIPDPDTILGHLAPGPDEGPDGYIAAADVAAIVDALLSMLWALGGLIGDPSLLVAGVPEHDLVHYLAGLEGRLDALEGGSAVPSPSGTLEVDLYGGSFVRVRDVDGVLAAGGDVAVTFELATVAGPGGEVLDPVAGVPAGTAGVWYDAGGTLGPVVTGTGGTVTQTTLRNWTKYGNPAAPPYYLVWCRLDTATDPARPRLVADHVVSVSS